MTQALRRQRIGAAGCGMDIACAGGSATVTTTTMTTAIMDTALPMAMDQASVSASAEEADTSVVVIAGKLDASKGNPAWSQVPLAATRPSGDLAFVECAHALPNYSARNQCIALQSRSPQ